MEAVAAAMSELAKLVDLLFPFFGMVALGIVCARAARLPEAGLAWMQVFLIYLALPCLFFRLVSRIPVVELANGWFIAGTTGSTALAFGLSVLIGRAGRLGPSETVITGVSGSYSNIGYMGPPLIGSLLGPAASAPVALIFVFDTVLLFTLVPTLMGMTDAVRGSRTGIAGEILRRVLLNPFMIATILGLVASVARWQPPGAIDTIVGWLSGASAPSALYILGLTVALRPARRITPGIWALVATKLLLHPVIVWLVLMAVGGIDRIWIETAVVMAALPPALNIFVLARQYDVGVEQASACVLAGTLASIATLTTFIWLLETGRMPLDLF